MCLDIVCLVSRQMLKCFLSNSFCIPTSASEERVFLGLRREPCVIEGGTDVCCWSFWPCWHKFAVNRLWPNDLWVFRHGVVKENLTFRLFGCCGSCCLTRHYGSVFCPEVKRHQQANVQAAVCWSLCRFILPLLSALGAEWKLTFSTMLSLHGAKKCWDIFLWCSVCYEWNKGALKHHRGDDLSMQEM